MADTIKRLAKGIVPASQAVHYTVPASTKCIVKEMIICNNSTAAVTFKVAAASIYIVHDKPIPASETLVIPLNMVLHAGESIETIGSSGTALTYYISGVELT